MSGWLLAQLPRAMSQDTLVQAFVDAAEGIGDSVRLELDSLEYQLDPDMAPDEMLEYLSAWLGFPLDPHDDLRLRRALVRTVGQVLIRRGTAGALQTLLVQLTGGPVVITEGGGIWGPGVRVADDDPTVRVTLSQLGPLSTERLTAIVERELPIGVRLDISVAGEARSSKETT